MKISKTCPRPVFQEQMGLQIMVFVFEQIVALFVTAVNCE